MATVKLQVNTHRLVAGLRYAFTSQDVLIGELLQNARRAGATKVDIHFLQETGELIVEDNGCGISDFQQLLTVAESGWDDSVQAEEHPFGMGFFSALFSAKQVEVISRGKRLAFESSEALSFDDLKIEDVALDLPGTHIKLTGLTKLGPHNINHALNRYCKGFSVPVSYNGEMVPRPHAPSALRCKKSDIGLVCLRPTTAIVAYLQGIQVFTYFARSAYGDEQVNVVHLDSSFQGRMPDRNVLVDAEEARRRIEDAVRNLWRSKLIAAKKTKSAKEFAKTYWQLACDWPLIDVMDDVPYLPSQALSWFMDYPATKADWSDDYLMYYSEDDGVSQTQVVKKEVTLCTNHPRYEGDTHWAAALMARRLEWTHVDLRSQRHWAAAHVLNLADMDVQVEYKKLHKFQFEGRWLNCEIVLCDQYTLHDEEHRVVIDDEAVFINNFILVPGKSSGVEALRQARDYLDDEQFQDDDHHMDSDLLQRLVSAEWAKLRGESQEVTLANILNAGDIENFDSLRNSTFVVRLGQKLKPEITQLTQLQSGALSQFLESQLATPAS